MDAAAKPVPPRIVTRLTPGMFAGVVLAAAALGAGTMIYFFNPGTHTFYPECAFHALTGWNCPTCGATRAVYALLHGNLRLAFKDNALLLLGLAALAVWSVRQLLRRKRRLPAGLNIPPNLLWGLLVLAVLFAVLRNLPGFGWLSP